jgi:putative tricarboxylic transport membrane protein
MRFNDAVFGIILVAFSAAMMIYADTTFPGLPGQDYGPAFFPVGIGGVLFACGVILTVQGIAKRHDQPLARFGDWIKSPRHIINLLLVLLSLVFFVVASDWLGFIPTSFLILAVLMYRFGCRPVMAVGLAIVVTLLTHSAFYLLLRVPLPWGILQPVAW